MIRLRYVGNGAFLDGVPARDLTADEARALDEERLIASGLYVRVQSKRLAGPTDNKQEA